MAGIQYSFPFGGKFGLFSGAFAVSFRECNCLEKIKVQPFSINEPHDLKGPYHIRARSGGEPKVLSNQQKDWVLLVCFRDNGG